MKRLFSASNEALRALLRSRGYLTRALLVQAVGVAVIGSAFALIYGVVLRPLPFKDSSRLVMAVGCCGPSDFQDITARSSFFSATTLGALGLSVVGTPAGPERLWTMAVRPNFFPMLGITPLPGRAFATAEYKPGAARTALLGGGFARDEFGSELGALGKTIVLDSAPHTVIGVVPSRLRLRFEWMYPPVAVWIPLTFGARQIFPRGARAFTPDGPGGGAYFPVLIARLRNGISLGRAQQDLNRVVRSMVAEHPEDSNVRELRLYTLQAMAVGPAGTTLWPLFGLSLAFLAIACMNLAGLALVRRVSMLPEMGVRGALGASPADLMLLPLVESIWVGLIGGALGSVICFWTLRAFRSGAPAGIVPRLAGFGVDWRVAAFLFAASILGAAAAGLAPALLCRRLALAPSPGNPHNSRLSGPGPSGRALVLAQCAIATLLVAMSGVMLRSVWRLSRTALGFDPANVVKFEVGPIVPSGTSWTDRKIIAAYEHVWATVGAIPGIQAVALGNPYGEAARIRFRVAGAQGSPPATADWLSVSPNYFGTLRIPLATGREFSARDDLGAPAVAVVNRALDQDYFEGRPAVGQSIEVSFAGQWHRVQVVGVAENNKMAGAWRSGAAPTIYTSLFQFASSGALFARVDPGAFPGPAPLRRSVARAVGGGFSVAAPAYLSMALSRALERPRFFSSFLTGVGVAALFLALAGVYSVAAIEARVRRREMAIRQALGASYCHLTARVLRHPLLLGAGGAVCGVIAAELLMDTLRVWLFGLRPAGAATCAWAGIGIVLACLLSALGPLIQVLRLQPAVVLRHE